MFFYEKLRSQKTRQKLANDLNRPPKIGIGLKYQLYDGQQHEYDYHLSI